MMAEPACSCTRWGLLDLDLIEARVGQIAPELVDRQRSRDAAGELLRVLARDLVHVGIGHDVADGESSPWPQDAGGLEEDPALVRGEVDHAVGDDHVDRRVVQGNVLDLAFEELDILGVRLGRVVAGQGEHLVGHVEAVGPSAGAHSSCGQQDVDPAARSEVEDRLALVQLGHGRRIAAAEGGELRGFG